MEPEFDYQEERNALIRETRQRLELLRRSGVEHLLVERDKAPRSTPPEPLETTLAQRRTRPGSAAGSPPPAALVGVTPEIVSPLEILEPIAEQPVSHLAIPSVASVLRVEVAPMSSKPTPVAKVTKTVTPSLFGEPELELPVISADERPAMLAADAAVVAACTKCKELAETRTQTVYGTGSATARLMFIGEAPGADEDRTGVPFVGRAGQLLTEMITKGMGIAREDVYIANILKCRPPENRQPTVVECANCIGYLERQIAVIRPEFICLLGRTAAQGILETTLSMGHLRGKWYRYRGIATLVTYHPSYLLRVPSSKKEAWEDLQMLMKAMGLAIPRRK